MKKLQMKLTGADIRSTKAGDRDYLKAQFRGDNDGEEITASINLNDTDENIDLIEKLINDDFETEVEFDESKVASGTFQGKPYHAVDVNNKSAVKDAMGIQKSSISDALKNKRNRLHEKSNSKLDF